MAFEKSGCLQLTQEDYQVLRSIVNNEATFLIKAAAVLDKLGGISVDEASRILESGEYRIVED